MANGVNDRAFSAMKAAASDKTFVDLFKIPEETTEETKKDKETWKNFDKALGDFPKDQKRILKKLWVEGGRPLINIVAGYSAKKEGDATYFSDLKASYGGTGMSVDDLAEGKRDTLNISLASPVKDFMAEVSHAFQFRRKHDEDVIPWADRRELMHKRFKKEIEKHGKDVYGKESLIPSKLQTNPDIEINTEKGFLFPTLEGGKDERFIYDPETRLGRGGEKPPIETEAHRIIEDSLWQDYEGKFGREWSKRGSNWRPYSKRWSNVNYEKSIDNLIEKGLVR